MQTDKIIELYKQFNSVLKVARSLKKAERTVKRILLDNGICLFSRGSYRTQQGYHLETQKERIIDLYSIQNKSISEIGKLLNCPQRSVSALLRKNKIPTHTKRIQDILKDRKDEIIRIYHKCHKMNKTAEELGCDSDSLRLFFRNERIPYKSSKQYNTSIPDVNEIEKIRKMVLSGATMMQIGKCCERAGPQIAKICDDNKISRPTVTEQSKKNGILSVHSTFRRKLYVLPSGSIWHLQGYEPQFLDYVFGNKLLDEADIVHNPPKLRYIEGGKSRNYYPDFYIPKWNMIVEIKSEWTLQKQTAYTQQLKENATVSSGFEYLLILDNNFTEFDDIVKSKQKEINN